MGFADIVLVCYILGSLGGVLGLFPRWESLRRPAAWAIGAGFAIHTLLALSLFATGDIEGLTRGELIQLMAWSLVFVYCVAWWRLRFPFLGLTAGPLALILFFFASLARNIDGGLPASMTGAFFVLHLVVLFLNFALITLGLGSALFFCNMHRKLKAKKLLSATADNAPALATVDRINRLVVMWGFPLFSIGLVTGFIWAHITRGAVVTSDPKEVASIFIWLLYALAFVQRFVFGWQGKKAAVMLVILFAVMVMSLVGVNLFMNSHHNFFQPPAF